MQAVIRDLQYALRSLRNTPQFTLIAVLTLALGIGANTAIFSLLDNLQFRNIAVMEPQRLVRMEIPGRFAGATWGGNYCIDHPMFRDLENAPKDLFSGVAAVFHSPVSLAVKGNTERATAMLISGSGFRVFGLQPAAGRLFTEEDDQQAGAHAVVVLSHAYWRRRFQADPAVVGESMLVNNRPMTIVGVAPEGFRGTDFSSVPDVFVPMRMKNWVTPTWDGLEDPVFRWLQVFARLSDGITREQAEERLQTLKTVPFQRYLEHSPVRDEQFVKSIKERRVLLQSAGAGFSQVRVQSRNPLWIMMGLVFCVLVVACANISGLLIARLLRRERELAIRLALGAGRGDILRICVMESFLLAASGCLLGMAFAEWGGGVLMATLPGEIAGNVIEQVVDQRVLLFTIGISGAVAAIFSIVPLVSLNIRGMIPALRHGAGNINTGAGGLSLRKLLVAGQIAVCLPVMMGATLLLSTLENLKHQDLGVQPENIVQFQVDPLLNGYQSARTQWFYRELTEALEGLPGVEAVGLSDSTLFSGDSRTVSMNAPGEEAPAGQRRNVILNHVNASYFRTLGIPIVAGRPLAETDSGSHRVAVINEETSRRFFGNQIPLGRQMCFGLRGDSQRCFEVVGIAKDARQVDVREEQQAIFYGAHMQDEDTSELTVYVRSTLPAEQIFAMAREAVGKLDSSLPIYNLRSLQSQVDENLVAERLLSLLTSAFGVVTTLLAAVGLYGVLAFLVATRTKEIGVRMALGARPSHVIGLVFREVGWMVAIGMAVGLPLCYLVGGALQSQLYGVEPWDPGALLPTSLLLLGVALGAGAIPAAIAARTNPMAALRNE